MITRIHEMNEERLASSQEYEREKRHLEMDNNSMITSMQGKQLELKRTVQQQKTALESQDQKEQELLKQLDDVKLQMVQLRHEFEIKTGQFDQDKMALESAIRARDGRIEHLQNKERELTDLQSVVQGQTDATTRELYEHKEMTRVLD